MKFLIIYLFFTGTLYVLDATGVDAVITNTLGAEGNTSTLKRAFASAVILEGFVILGNSEENSELDRLKIYCSSMNNNIEKILINLLKNDTVIFVIGMKSSGKTTLLLNYRQCILFISMNTSKTIYMHFENEKKKYLYMINITKLYQKKF